MQCVRHEAGSQASSIVGVASEADIVKKYRDGITSTSLAAAAARRSSSSSSEWSSEANDGTDTTTLRVWAGLIFENVMAPSYDLPDHVSYRIRLNGSSIPDTSVAGPSEIEIEAGGDIDKGSYYASSGFMTLQSVVDTCILQYRLTQRGVSSHDMPPFLLQPLKPVYRAFPRAATTSDLFHQYSVGLGSLYLVTHSLISLPFDIYS
jgi:hypothetical protein